MRNIAEIIEDDRNGKQLSQTERQIVTAYIQGKYDAVRELKIGNNDAMETLDKLRAEIIEKFGESECAEEYESLYELLEIIDKYKGGNEEKK